VWGGGRRKGGGIRDTSGFFYIWTVFILDSLLHFVRLSSHQVSDNQHIAQQPTQSAVRGRVGTEGVRGRSYQVLPTMRANNTETVQQELFPQTAVDQKPF